MLSTLVRSARNMPLHSAQRVEAGWSAIVVTAVGTGVDARAFLYFLSALDRSDVRPMLSMLKVRRTIQVHICTSEELKSGRSHATS
jgi:hypothetical protein